MLIKDVYKKIIEEIEPKLSALGFKYLKGKKYFKRESEGVQQIFDLLFYKYPDHSIRIKPVIQLKIKKIEDIYHLITVKESKYNDGTKTLGNNLFEIMEYYDNNNHIGSEHINSKYLIENDADIELLMKIIPKRFKEYVLRYFDENSSIARVDELLNNDPRSPSIHNYLYPVRACIAVIAAKLNQNLDLPVLLNIYEEELEDAHENSKYEFKKLKEVLANYSEVLS